MPGRIRRLSRSELASTLSDLLGEQAGTLAASVQPDSSVTKYSTGAERSVNSNYASDLNRVAALAALELSHATESTILSAECARDEASGRACVRNFIARFGAHAWRRPLTDEEIEELLAVYEVGRLAVTGSEPGAALRAGSEYVARALLQAPSFVFRTELGIANGPGEVALSSYEAASALSYGLTGSPPDAELMRQAESGALGSAQALTEQGRRLLQAYPDRYAKQAELFIREWLEIDLSSPVWHKDAQLYPLATEDFRSALDRSTSLFLRDWARTSSFSELMTTPRSFVSRRTAWLDGIAEESPYFVDGAPEFATIELAGHRAGVLTLPSFLGSRAHEAASSPVWRGVTIMSKLLCRQPPPVPAVVPPLPLVDPSRPRTTRARFEQHTTAPACAGCHLAFDPMGNALEHYDAVGAYRDFENGVPIDSAGALVDGTDTNLKLADAAELASALASRPDVHACFVRQAYRFVSGRLESEADAPALSVWAKHFDEQGANVKELMLELVTMLATLPRTSSAEEP